MPVGGHGWIGPGAEANAYAEGTETGPLISKAHREKVTDYVKRGVEAGAHLRRQLRAQRLKDLQLVGIGQDDLTGDRTRSAQNDPMTGTTPRHLPAGQPGQVAIIAVQTLRRVPCERADNPYIGEA